MIRSKKLASISFLAIFFFGMAIGVVLERFVFDDHYPGRHGHDPGKYLFNKFSKELSLDEDQKTRLKKLLEEIREKHRRIRDANRRQYDEIRSEFDLAFRRILTPEQLEKYEQLVQKFKAARERYEQKREEKK